MKGVYINRQGNHAVRISRGGQTIHLGTFEDEVEAGKTYDAACLIFAKPPSAYNFSGEVTRGRLQQVLAILREKEVLTMEDVISIDNRYTIIEALVDKLEAIHAV